MTAVQYVKGVGPARAERLKRLDIVSVEDLLRASPRRYEDRSRFVSIEQMVPGEAVTIRGRLVSVQLKRIGGRRTIVEASVTDGTGAVGCLWFNQPYLANQMKAGDDYVVYGKPEAAGRKMRFIHPEMERMADSPAAVGTSSVGNPAVADISLPGRTLPARSAAGNVPPRSDAAEAGLHTGRIVPIYPLTEGVGQRWLRSIVRAALDKYRDAIPEALPPELLSKHRLAPLAWSLEQFHFPGTWDSLAQARRRLAFEELWLLQVRLAIRRAKWTSRRKTRRYRLDGPLVEAFRSRLPYQLTGSQQRVLQELLADLADPAPMLRLLQGDVGCGKTVVAACAMAAAAQSGYQTAFMAPTELLAQQHHRVLSEWFEPLGAAVRLVSQAVPPAERPALKRGVADGSVRIVVGTHALIQSTVTFARLGLVVIDEQHKFGVAQRAALVRKGQEPDVLVMTATPIPRTLALSLYGDLACSTITEMPPGRRPVKTEWHGEAGRAEVYARIREQLELGRQAYVVYPVIDPRIGPARSELKAASQMAKQLATVFAGFAVELLHGQMPASKKEAVMRAFASGRVRVLVSTVIVEVGLDVPNATVMLIEHPERFGLAQLHQLRGRIGRGAQPAACLLISDVEDELSRQRLQAFADTADGFRLAEQDLALRGPGELLGRQQHGWLRLRVADIVRDKDLLEQAREDAFAMVERDRAGTIHAGEEVPRAAERAAAPKSAEKP